VRLGATKDGTNIDDVPAQLRGVTCFFCHTVDTVNGPFHNNPLVSGSESTFRAAIADPLASAPHGAEGSPLLDQTNERSIPLCGACHDIQLPQGTSIERTFFEWQHSRFGLQEGQAKTGCGTCHMPARAGRAAEVPGAPMRTVHDHSMVGVDLAIAPFPEKDAQRQGVHSFLDTAVIANLCVRPGESGAFEVEVDLTNTTVGHNWPSGSNQDRRAWVKLTATKGTDTLLSIGDVPDDKAVELTPGIDSVALFRDHLIDANGNETRMFWEAARYTSLQLPAAITSDPATPGFDNTYRKTITVPGGVSPDTVHMEVRIRPIDYDLVDDLIASGDLDPAAVPGITTFTLTPTSLDWTADRGFGCVR
jgi:hypothetical protein